MANLIPLIGKNGMILNNTEIKRSNNLLSNSNCNTTQFGEIFKKEKMKERKSNFSESICFWKLKAPSNFFKAVFHKFYLVHSWILCPIWNSALLFLCVVFVLVIKWLGGWFEINCPSSFLKILKFQIFQKSRGWFIPKIAPSKHVITD